MVAKTPPLGREKRSAAALNPALIRETLKKVDKCVARLQEMQHTVSGGRKMAAIGSFSPRSTTGYLGTNLRMKNGRAIQQKSPPGKFPSTAIGEWHRMSLPAMLLGETLLEIQQATRFTKRVAAAVRSAATIDPKTPPLTQRRRPGSWQETQLHSRRAREKQHLGRTGHCGSPSSLPRARTRISFRPVSPRVGGVGGLFRHHPTEAHKLSPKGGSPWRGRKKKASVLFPNAAFNPSPSPAQRRSSTMVAKNAIVPGIKRSPPHKFLVKSPAGASKFQVRIKNPPTISISPVRSRKMQEMMKTPAKVLRRSFSPSKLASRLVSPIKSRLSAYRRKSCSSVDATSKWRTLEMQLLSQRSTNVIASKG